MRPRDTLLIGLGYVPIHFLQPIKKFGTSAHKTMRHYDGGVLKGFHDYQEVWLLSSSDSNTLSH